MLLQFQLLHARLISSTEKIANDCIKSSNAFKKKGISIRMLAINNISYAFFVLFSYVPLLY